jgi:hypothetical protein
MTSSAELKHGLASEQRRLSRRLIAAPRAELGDFRSYSYENGLIPLTMRAEHT